GSGGGTVMDVEREQLTSSNNASQPALPSLAAAWPTPIARPVLPVRSVETRRRRRWLRRLAGRVVFFLLDAVVINGSFYIAFYVRFVIFRGVAFGNGYAEAALSDLLSLQVLITAGLLAIFSLKGLYRLHPASALLKQFWVVASATTSTFAVFSAFD